MKNMHVLSTDKPSRLLWSFEDRRYYSVKEEMFFKNQNELQNQNIYITSDEEIKEGWYINTLTNYIVKGLGVDINWKHIILTTDQDLINDGVQAVDDEFLEWFVKNASCERVEVDKAEHGMIKDNVYYKLSDKIFYKTIIPKEEKTKCYCGHTTTCDCGPEEPKQEKKEDTS